MRPRAKYLLLFWRTAINVVPEIQFDLLQHPPKLPASNLGGVPPLRIPDEFAAAPVLGGQTIYINRMDRRAGYEVGFPDLYYNMDGKTSMFD